MGRTAQALLVASQRWGGATVTGVHVTATGLRARRLRPRLTTYALVTYATVGYSGCHDHGTRPSLPTQGPLESVVAAVKPHLRGWLHAGMVPLALAAGIVLIALAPTTPARIAAAVFSVTAWLLFGTSAVYHRGNWSPKVAGVLKRMDHSNIFLIIAGTYTPFALLLPRDDARTMLLIVWSGAIAGVLFRVFWVGAPRWLYTPGLRRPRLGRGLLPRPAAASSAARPSSP